MHVAMLVLLLPRLALSAEPVRATVYVSNEGAMDERQLTLFERSLLYELGKREGVLPVSRPPPPVESAAEQCPERQTSCLTQLAQGLGADEVVAVHAVSMWNAKVLTVKRLHIQSAEIKASITKHMPASGGEAFLMILGDVVDELYADRPRAADIDRGIPTAVIERWSPPPLHPATMWTGAGLTVAALATGITFGMLANDAESEFTDLGNSGGTISGAELARLRDTANSRATVANVFYASTVVLAAGTVLAWLFSDWSSDEAALLELAAGGSSLSLTF